jgi:hypothetical protein
MPQSPFLAPVIAWVCLCGPLAVAGDAPGGPYPAHALPRSTPERQGVMPSSAILDFITAADKDIDSMHSFMLRAPWAE